MKQKIIFNSTVCWQLIWSTTLVILTIATMIVIYGFNVYDFSKDYLLTFILGYIVIFAIAFARIICTLLRMFNIMSPLPILKNEQKELLNNEETKNQA